MINVYDFCANRAKYAMGESLDDEMVMLAMEIQENEEKLRDIRADRWQLATIGLNRAGSPVIEVLDKAALKSSIDREEAIRADITRNKALFGQLNPIFAQATGELVRFSQPTLKHLAAYKQDCANRAFMMDRDLKTDLHFRLTSGKSHSKNLDEVLSDPDFVAHKQQVETTIRGLQEEARKAQEYISRIEGILRN
jgi:hypothetical protein